MRACNLFTVIKGTKRNINIDIAGKNCTYMQTNLRKKILIAMTTTYSGWLMCIRNFYNHFY